MLLSIILSTFRRLRTAFVAKIKGRMKPQVHLYIGEQEVELSQVPDILYNWTSDDVLSPAAVKNSYSKTVTIPGTDRNNRIFGSIWDLSSTSFNAGKKTSFSIFLDGEEYETGYCRLDSFTRNKNNYTYNLSLFGGLGSFFYSLAYSDDALKGTSSQKKLSDLVFRYDGEGSQEVDLGFTINKDTVKDAWDAINSYSTKWRFINFCPTAYNGLPEDFDANKVMIMPGTTRRVGRGYQNINGWASAVTVDGERYIALGGYAVGEMDRDRTESEMREFRSYLQRPVIRVKEVINACCLPENNGGYEVVLDDAFFNADSPYWNDTWCTLPMLTSLDYTSQVTADETTTAEIGALAGSGFTSSGTTQIWYLDRNVDITGQGDNAINVTVSFKLGADISNSNYTYWNTSVYKSSQRLDYAGGVGLQLVAYDAFGKAVAGSDYYWLASMHHHQRTSGSGGRGSVANQVTAVVYGPDTFNYDFYGNNYVQANGSFIYSNGHFLWQGGKEFTLKVKNVPKGCTIKLLITKMGINAGGTNFSFPAAQAVFTPTTSAATTWTYSRINGFTLYDAKAEVDIISSEVVRTGAKFTKKDILNTEYSPLDFLLSYTKLFGLYYRCDPVRKRVDILTRGSFFNPTGTPIDIQDKIDVTSWTVKPIAFDKKWYRWDIEKEDSEYGEEYEKVYGKPYGEQVINTGYDFNNETEDVLSGNIFKGAVQCCERSTDYCYVPSHPYQIPWEFSGFKYLLYGEDDSSKSTEVEVKPSSTIDAFSAVSEYKYYDITDRVQLHTSNNSPSEGGSVLLFNYGEVSLLGPNGTGLGYYLTDSNSYMSALNDGRDCWLRTDSETDRMGNKVAVRLTSVPKFGRYEIYPASGYIVKSLDFGEPETLFIPGAVSRPDGTIYNTFWKSYIEDLYSKDTRVVSTKMLIETRPTVDWLRKWYYFDNSIWRMTKIKDYNVGTYGLTPVEFVKVNDPLNYGNGDYSGSPGISIRLSESTVGSSGATITYTVTVTDGGPWYMEWGSDLGVTPVVTGLDEYGRATGDTTGTIEIPVNGYSNNLIHYYFYVYADPASARATLTQESTHFSVSRNDDAEIPASGGTTTFTIISDLPWTATTNAQDVIPATGDTTDSAGTVVTVSVGANNYYSYAQYSFEVTNGSSTYRNPYAIRQKPLEGKSAVLQPPYNRYYPASGTQQTIYVNCSDPWVWSSYNGLNYTDLGPNPQSASTTAFTYTLPQNTGATKYDQPRVYLYDNPGIQSDYYYIRQWPTFAIFYNTKQGGYSGQIQPTNPAGICDIGGNQISVSENVYREHKPGNTTLQPFYYSFEMAFPQQAYSIKDGAFSGCTGLTSMYISGVTVIGSNAFEGCTNLTAIDLYDTEWIYPYAFKDTALTGFTIPETVTNIGAYAFAGTTFTTIYFEGTSAQWQAVTKDPNWDADSAISMVVPGRGR